MSMDEFLNKVKLGNTISKYDDQDLLFKDI